MAISIYTFTPNTKIESAKVNTNFSNLKEAVEDLQSEKTLHTNSDSDTITFDLSVSHMHTVTLGGNRTLQVSNAETGKGFLARLVQDETGGRTVSWWSGIKWPGGSAPTLSTDANKIDSFSFICTATSQYDGYFLGFGLS